MLSCDSTVTFREILFLNRCTEIFTDRKYMMPRICLFWGTQKWVQIWMKQDESTLKMQDK